MWPCISSYQQLQLSSGSVLHEWAGPLGRHYRAPASLRVVKLVRQRPPDWVGCCLHCLAGTVCASVSLLSNGRAPSVLLIFYCHTPLMLIVTTQYHNILYCSQGVDTLPSKCKNRVECMCNKSVLTIKEEREGFPPHSYWSHQTKLKL